MFGTLLGPERTRVALLREGSVFLVDPPGHLDVIPQIERTRVQGLAGALVHGWLLGVVV